MASTEKKLRSPDGTREMWCNEKEVAHLTNRPEPGQRWTIVETDEVPPQDPNEIADEAAEAEVAAAPTAQETLPPAKKGKSR